MEFKFSQPGETLSFFPPISIEGSWMTGMISLEVFKSILNITHEDNDFELYTDTFDEFSFKELKNELEENLSFLNISYERVQDEKIGPRKFSEHKNQETERRHTDGYYMLMSYARPLFRSIQSYLRIVVGLDENDIQLILKQYIFELSLLMNNSLAFTQLKIFQALFTPWMIMKEL